MRNVQHVARNLVNPVENNSAAQWLVRVQGKEYGPVDVEELRAWRDDGRLIRTNEVREVESERWFPAAELPEVFADVPQPPPLPALVRQSGLGELLGRTWRIYLAHFGQYLALSALVFVPSVCGQLSSAAANGNGDLDLRSALAGLFNFCMFAASVVGWPLYIAGLQILTTEAAQGRSATLANVVARAAKFWWRVALLCVLVYGAFFLLIVLAFGILAMLVAGPPSLVVILVALLLLVFQVWMFSRVFISFLFWQPAAVLENKGVSESLRRSKELAHSEPERPSSQRPKWRGAILASLWFIVATALSIGPEWSTLTNYFHALTTLQDPQAIMQSMTASAQAAGLAPVALVLGVLQQVLRPLLGIAFVLLYLEIVPAPNE